MVITTKSVLHVHTDGNMLYDCKKNNYRTE